MIHTSPHEANLIQQAIAKQAKGQYKWAYLIFDLVQQKRDLHISYKDIATWLGSEGFHIRENALRKSMWDYRKRISATKDSLIKPEPKVNQQFKGNKLLFSSDNPEDLSELLRERTLKTQQKNTGFDLFDEL